MKYPKFLQMLTLAAVVTTALPTTEIAVHASEKETPKEYEARTDYSLPEGYHYVLSEGKYVTFGDNGKAVVEKNETKKASAEKAKPKESKAAVVKKAEPEKEPEKEEPEKDSTGDKKTDEENSQKDNNSGDVSGKDAENPKEEEKKKESGTTEEGGEGIRETGSGEGSGTVEGGETGSGTEEGGETGSGTEEGGETGSGEGSGTEEGGETGSGTEEGGEGTGETGSGAEEGGETGSGTVEGGEGTGETGGGAVEGGEGTGETGGGTVEGGENENKIGDVSGIEDDADAAGSKGTENSNGISVQEKSEDKKVRKKYELPTPRQKKIKPNLNFKASRPFTAIGDRICYNVEVPIEGIPSFITQEMVVGALKVQDETGFPASVTIAQIIKESGYGKYGPGGNNGQGLSYLAYQYCNLFGIKGTGTAGSAVMKTNEMTSGGETYSVQAGFRVYNTYTECIEDRSRILKNVYSDLTANVTDANTFAMRIGARWATGINYGQGLIKTMETYDLYRLDDMTLVDFSNMIGTFADPCPGSHITSTFGYRDFDNKFHKGLDMGTGAQNIPTYAADAGTVTFAGTAGAAGNLIVIDHGNGLVTKYMHHSRIYVKIGQKVEKGQQIGLSGTTGHSTGNHLHFQVEKDGVAMNPAIYLMNDGLQAKACN